MHNARRSWCPRGEDLFTFSIGKPERIRQAFKREAIQAGFVIIGVGVQCSINSSRNSKGQIMPRLIIPATDPHYKEMLNHYALLKQLASEEVENDGRTKEIEQHNEHSDTDGSESDSNR